MHQLTITMPGYIVSKIEELISLFGGKVLSNKVEVAGIFLDPDHPTLDGKTLKRIRLNLNLSQHRMGEKLGIERTQYCRYETGYLGITPQRAKDIISKLTMEQDLLVGDKMRAEIGIQSH